MEPLFTVLLWILGALIGLTLLGIVLAYFVHVFLTMLRAFEEGNVFPELIVTLMSLGKKTGEKKDD